MKVVGAYQAKVHLADLLTEAERGETIVVTRRGKAVAKLVPLRSEHMSVEAVAKEFEKMRRSTRPIEGGLRQLIEEGRRF